jgi:murein DD-endopeptidase MepM/ murein hydrolase activator NlpD
MTDGGASLLAPEWHRRAGLAAPLAALALALCAPASAQSLYKYRGEDGQWIYTDRAPGNSEGVEVRHLSLAPVRATVQVSDERVGGEIRVIARNGLHAPVEVGLLIKSLSGVERPQFQGDLSWVVPARGARILLRLPLVPGAAAPAVEYDFDFMPGDPGAVHNAKDGYRAPFVAAANYPITQAYPDNVTHQSVDSEYAIDIAMPVGTDVLAARGGVVFDVIGTNYRGGTDREAHLHAANIVRILHDDGTFAVYAHLNWNSIRVRPGERVQAGQYIADSGNTGFSSGPHLHFAVQRNAGMHIEALPVVFSGPNSRSIVPATGNVLTSYR